MVVDDSLNCQLDIFKPTSEKGNADCTSAKKEQKGEIHSSIAVFRYVTLPKKITFLTLQKRWATAVVREFIRSVSFNC